MEVRIKCRVCEKFFLVNDLHIKAKAASCPYCGASQRLEVFGKPVQCKIIRNRSIGPLKGYSVYCAKCMNIVFMPHSIPRCPDCNSANIYPVVANYTLPSELAERFRKDNDLWEVAFVTRPFGVPVKVLMPLKEVREIEKDKDKPSKRSNV
jgi:Zn finger protein HypA/HybF involved in hydrogenase expression